MFTLPTFFFQQAHISFDLSKNSNKGLDSGINRGTSDENLSAQRKTHLYLLVIETYSDTLQQ